MWVQFLPGGLKGAILIFMLGKNLTNEEKLDAIYEMTLENHEVLKTIRRQQYFATAGRLLYWLLILGVVGGTYFYLRPVIDFMTTNSSKLTETFLQLNQLKDQLPEARVLNQLLEGLQKSVPVAQ